MYTGKQFKNEVGKKVSRQIECGGARQRVKMKDGGKDFIIQGKFEYIQEKLLVKGNRPIQKKDVRKKLTDGNPSFLCYDIQANNGMAYQVNNVRVFDNGIVFDGGSPGNTYVKGFKNLKSNLWVRFHILNQLLGGPGDDSGNLIPTRQSDNKSSYWSTVEENMKVLASHLPGLSFHASVKYHDNSIFPSSLTGEYGTIGEEMIPIEMSFDPPKAEDFKQNPQTYALVGWLAQYNKKDRDKIFTKIKETGYLLPNSEDYIKEREYRTLYLRLFPPCSAK